METDIPPEMLVAARAAVGWTQEDAAQWAGLGVATVKRAERDTLAHARAVDKLVEAYRTAGVTISIAADTMVLAVDRRASERARRLIAGQAVIA